MGRSPRDRKIEASSLKAHSGAGKLYSKGRISVLLGVPVPSDLGDYKSTVFLSVSSLTD